MTAFKSKAGAMSFAILMNASVSESGARSIDYDETKELFDFICENVNLPDVERGAMGDMVGALKDMCKDLPNA